MKDSMMKYCSSCRTKQGITNPIFLQVTLKDGKVRDCIRGVCVVCGSKMFSFHSQTSIINDVKARLSALLPFRWG